MTPQIQNSAAQAAKQEIDAIMEEAQAFASAWSLIGGRFDDGNMAENAQQSKQRLFDMVSALRAPVADERALPKWLDVALLRRRAEQASSGEWQALARETSNTFDVHLPNKSPVVHWMGFDGADMSRKQKAANARYIAAAGPRTVLALLDALASAPVSRLPDVEPEPRTAEDYAVPPITGSADSAPVAGERAACPTDVCQAGKADGVLCASDECDRASGVRSASAPAARKARPTDWQNALSITELPEVDEALATFCDDGTQDNAVGLVLVILEAAPQASAGAFAKLQSAYVGACDQIGELLAEKQTSAEDVRNARAEGFIAGFICAGGDAGQAKLQAQQFEACVDASRTAQATRAKASPEDLP